MAIATYSHREEAAASEAVFDSFKKPGAVWWGLFVILTVIIALGLVAWGVQIAQGMGVGGLGDYSFWGIDLANVITILGVSYGGAVVSAILRLTGARWRAPLTRLAEGTALICVAIGAIMILPHLGAPWRAWRMFVHPNFNSPEFWDMVSILTYTVATLVFFFLPLIPDMATLVRRGAHRLGKGRARLYSAISKGWTNTPKQHRTLSSALGVMAILIIPLAISVHSVLSWAFSVVERPWWHESVWAPYFVVAALYSGVALVILVIAAFRKAYKLEAFITDQHFARLGALLAVFGATYLYLTIADFLPAGYAGAIEVNAVFSEILLGRYAIWFWIFVVFGGILPILLFAFKKTRNAMGMTIAAVMIIPAMWIKRMLMVVVPPTYDRINEVFHDPNITWVWWVITAAAFAAIPWGLMLLFRIVPPLDITEMAELANPDSGVDSGSAETEVDDSHTRQPAGATMGSDDAGAATVAKRVPTGWKPVLAAVATLGIGAVVATMPAHAQGPADEELPPGQVQIQASSPGGSTVEFQVELKDASGQPMAGETVVVSQTMLDFGDRAQPMPLGEITTDDNGAGTLSADSTVAGQQTFHATFAGNDTIGETTAETTADVAEAKTHYVPSHENPTGDIGRPLQITLGVTVIAVWVVIIAQLVRVLRVRGAGDKSDAVDSDRSKPKQAG